MPVYQTGLACINLPDSLGARGALQETAFYESETLNLASRLLWPARNSQGPDQSRVMEDWRQATSPSLCPSLYHSPSLSLCPSFRPSPSFYHCPSLSPCPSPNPQPQPLS